MQQTIQYQPNSDDMELANRMVQVRSRSVSEKASAELEGALGEVVFARVFGLEVPEPQPIRSDGGVDFILPSSATVDVKSISGEGYDRLGLLVPRRVRAGLYVLVHILFGPNEPSTILGYQTGGFAASRGSDIGRHWRVAQKDLRPADELYRHF